VQLDVLSARSDAERQRHTIAGLEGRIRGLLQRVSASEGERDVLSRRVSSLEEELQRSSLLTTHVTMALESCNGGADADRLVVATPSNDGSRGLIATPSSEGSRAMVRVRGSPAATALPFRLDRSAPSGPPAARQVAFLWQLTMFAPLMARTDDDDEGMAAREEDKVQVRRVSCGAGFFARHRALAPLSSCTVSPSCIGFFLARVPLKRAVLVCVCVCAGSPPRCAPPYWVRRRVLHGAGVWTRAAGAVRHSELTTASASRASAGVAGAPLPARVELSACRCVLL
jgi:hypothetical protein